LVFGRRNSGTATLKHVARSNEIVIISLLMPYVEWKEYFFEQEGRLEELEI
jgi:hypothetical protein